MRLSKGITGWGSISILLFISLFYTGFASAGNMDGGTMKVIKGAIWYRERMALPPDAQISVFLEDVSRMDVAAAVIASTRLDPEGGPPWQFELPYNSKNIHAKRHYALRVRIEAEGKLMFINTEHIPAFEKGLEGPIEIMVSRVGGDLTGSDPQPATADAALTETYWKLIKIGDQPAELGARQKELHLVLKEKELRVQGFSGCNQFSGGFTSNGEQLEFGPMMSTNMWCMNEMEQEQRFLKALGETTRFAISGDHLQFFTDQEQPLLSFKAVHLQ